jgi:isoamylase
LAGDEFGRTQQGNNNAYCQDSEISWLNWDLQQKGQSLIRFVKQLTGLRNKYPILHRSRFLTGAYDEELEIKDLTWVNAAGTEMTGAEWSDPQMRCFGMLIDGRARPSGVRQRGTEAAMLLVLNSYYDLVEFTLPECPGGQAWKLLLDTNIIDGTLTYQGRPGDQYGVTGRSLLLFVMAD